MADLNIALILRLVDRATAPARAAMRAIERIGGESLMRQAERVNAGARLMGAGLNDVGNAALRGGAMVTAYGAGMTALAASFVRPAAQFEQFNVQLTTLEGSAEGAERAMAWIEGFATRTPLSVEETVQAYARLRAFGLDPTTGSLQAMVDTMAATGGGAEKLDGLTLALGQAWTKGKLQGEEAMQMLERGVPVWDLLAEAMGKSAAEVQKLSEQGRLGREEITLLMEALGTRYEGAADRASQTWDGIISNLWDQWTRFQRMVMGSGLFVWMKGHLQQLLDTLNRMAADGSLKIWAETVGAQMMAVLQGIRDLGEGIYNVWNTVVPALDRFAEIVGGWDVLGWITLAALFSNSLLLVAGGIIKIGIGLAAITSAPIVALALAFTALAAVIYFNWDSIVTYFTDKIEAIRKAFDEGLLNGIWQVIAEFNPFTLVTEAAIGLAALILSAFDIDLYAIGEKWITDLRAGIAAQIDAMIAWVRAKFDAMIPDLPDWLRSPEAGGTAGIGGDSGYGGMAGALDDMAAFAAPVAPVAPLRMRAAPNGPSTNVNVGGITVNAAPGQSPEAVAREVRRQLSEAAAIRSWLDDRGLHAD
ncbi:MAG: tape measure protein [Rhodobacter sp.]|nr:tape measure protein [Rhodobacter sp.]